MTPLGRRLLAGLLCALALGAIAPAGAIQGTASDRCVVHEYAVSATGEDPGDVADTPSTGYYENQSADAQAVFDRARRSEGGFVTANNSEWEAIRTLPDIVVVNETGTVYRIQRNSHDCGTGLVGELSAALVPVVAALTLAGLVALLHPLRRPEPN